MAPPKFADLNKAVKDLFTDDFGAGEVKVTLKSKASNGLNLKVEGKKDNETNAVSAFLESKFDGAGWGIKEKWNTKNVVTTELSASDHVVKGSKVILETAFSPNTGLQSVKVDSEYKTDSVFFNTSMASGTFSAANVFSLNQWLVGAKADLDTSKVALKGYELGAAYKGDDLEINAVVKNGNDISGGIYHLPTANLKTGVQFAWSRGSSETSFAVAGSYKYDENTDLKVKIDKNLALGLALKQQVRPGITVGLSSKINAAQLNGDGHQLGLSLELSS